MSTLELSPHWMELFLTQARTLRPELANDARVLAHQLAPAVVALSSGLTRSRALKGQRYLDEGDKALAYLLYYLPVQMLKVRKLLEPALGPAARAAPAPLLITELGCGPGAGLWGVLEVLSSSRPSAGATTLKPNTSLEVRYTGIDHSKLALGQLRQLVARLNASARGLPTVRLETRIARLPGPDALPEAGQDLIVLSYTLNELVGDAFRSAGDAWSWLRLVLERLKPGGLLLIVEPGLQESANFLGMVRDFAALDGQLELVSPCTHRMPCPLVAADAPPRQWCHQELKWRRPALIEAIDRLTGLDKVRVAYSHLLLRRRNVQPDGSEVLEPVPVEPVPVEPVPVEPVPVEPVPVEPVSLDVDGSSLEPVGQYRALSPALKARGTVSVYLCGAEGFREAMLLTRHQNQANEALLRVDRGARVSLESAGEKGGKLRVEAETRVQVDEQV